jgi:enamine deaminase RidA (YjgF/YER057c/UK114 family)
MIKIRKSAESDGQAVYDLLWSARAEIPLRDTFENPDNRAWIMKHCGQGHIWVALDGKTLIGFLFRIAGQQGRDIDNKIVGAPGDFRAQTEQAFLNIKGALGAAGGGFEHVVKLCHYFIDLQAHYRMMRDIRLKYFDPARMPASTMIQVGALTDEKALYEVDVVAVLPSA